MRARVHRARTRLVRSRGHTCTFVYATRVCVDLQAWRISQRRWISAREWTGKSVGGGGEIRPVGDGLTVRLLLGKESASMIMYLRASPPPFTSSIPPLSPLPGFSLPSPNPTPTPVRLTAILPTFVSATALSPLTLHDDDDDDDDEAATPSQLHCQPLPSVNPFPCAHICKHWRRTLRNRRRCTMADRCSPCKVSTARRSCGIYVARVCGGPLAINTPGKGLNGVLIGRVYVLRENWVLTMNVAVAMRKMLPPETNQRGK